MKTKYRAVENLSSEIYNATAALNPQQSQELRARFGLIAQAKDPDETSLQEWRANLPH